MADGVDLASPDGEDGTWDTAFAKLTTAADAAGLLEWSLSVDSTIARAHQHATNTNRLTGGWIELYKNRNVVERQYCHLKQWRGLATRYNRHAIVYRAAVIAWTRQLSD